MNKVQLLTIDAIRMLGKRKLREGNAKHCGLLARSLMLMAEELDGDRERFSNAAYGGVDHADLLTRLCRGCDKSAGPLLTLLANANELAARDILRSGHTEHLGTIARALSQIARAIDGDIENFDAAMLGS